MSTPSDLAASPDDLASEIERLRARVMELEARLAGAEGAGPAPGLDAGRTAALFDRLPTALTLYDHELRYLRVNAAFAALHGRRPEDFPGRSLREMVPHLAARLEPYYRQVLATGEPIRGVEVEGEFPRGSGRRRHLLVDFYPLPRVDGRPAGTGAAVTDVTEVKATEAALREGEARFRSVVEADMIGIGFWESGGRITDANGALLELIGYTREEFADGAIPWATLTPPEYFASDEKAFAQMEAVGRCTPYQKEYVRRDGTRVPVLLGGAAFDDRRDRGAFFVIDLSERRRAELALRESEERLRTALAAAQTGTWRWDFVADVDTRDANFNALLGLPAVETLQPMADLLERVVPEDRPLVAARRRAAAERGEAYDVDLRVRRPDGAVRWLHDVGRVIRDEEGRPLYMTGACVDITARREAEAERGRLLDAEREARAEAERAEREAAFLAEAGRVLGASLDYETTLVDLADLSVPQVADWCVIDILDESKMPRRLVVSHLEPEKVESSWELYRRYPDDPAWPSAMRTVLGTGRSVLVEEVTPQLLDAIARDAEHRRSLVELGLVSYMVVPLEARGRVLGAIAFLSAESGRRFGADDLRLAERLARRAALAVDNAGLYREAQAAMRQTSVTLAMLDATFQAAPVGLGFLDRELRYVRVNRVLAELNGVSAEDHIGRPLEEVLPQWAPQIKPMFQSVLASGRPVLDLEVQVDAVGQARHLLASYFPVRGPEGEVDWVGGVVVDITERRQAEDALRQAQKLESIGVLAGGIAHDFNNLLTGIMGNASLALRMLPADGSARAEPLLHDVVRASERAADLTQQLLAYAGKGRFFIQPVDLPALVQEISGLVRTSIPKKVALQLHARDCPSVEADASQLQQVVMNLVINGAEAIGDAPGVVTVTTDTHRYTAAELQRRFRGFDLPAGEYVRLEVRDTGCGMDAATRARIFDPFFTTKFTGRGLGLAAVLGIVRGHRGAIAVGSAPGEGTTFTVILPAAPDATGVVPPAPEGTAEPRGAGTVLVVDDEEVVRRMAQNALQEYGYTTVTAENGLEAVDLVRRAPDRFRAVLLDMTMPVMGGEEAIAHLQRLCPDLPVLVSSGYGELEALRRFQGARVAGFLQKPYTARQLADALRAALTGAG